MLPFYTTKEVGKGTGLGLSISFEIINEMNGNIDIESDLFHGTTFRITLPIPEIKEKQMVKVL
jgi:two-component system NtrC family sensor kinase